MVSSETLSSYLPTEPAIFSKYAGSSSDGQRHCTWLSLPWREPFHSQVISHCQTWVKFALKEPSLLD